MTKLRDIQHLYLADYLQRKFPAGKLIGREFVMGDIDGTPGRSFSFNVDKGIGSDFSTGETYNIVKLISKNNNLSEKEAYKKIMREWGVNNIITPAKPQTPAIKKPKAVMPVPNDAPLLRIAGSIINEWGKPSVVWDYKNKTGETLYHVARFDKEGKKAYYPFVWTGDKWKSQHPDNPRPLYGMEGFKAGKNFIICEGEKAADAARRLCGWGVAISWEGGSNSVAYADWEVLRGQKVIIWRDNDAAGVKAQDILCKILAKLDCRIMTLADGFYNGRQEGWDAADALEENITPTELQELLKTYMVEYKESQFGGSEIVASQVAETKTTVESPIAEPLNRYYRLLGMVGTSFAFYNYTSGQVNIEKNSGLTKKFFLSLTNGDQEYWKNAYGYTDNEGEKKIAWDAVAGSIMGECNHQGQFDVDTIRGVGVWRDKNKIVVNAGKFLYVDGTKCAIDKFESDFLYQKSGEILASIDNPLSLHQRQQFASLCNMFSWEHQVSGSLLAGWLMIAPICGCLDWRPHLYICGMAGTGKSTIYRQILSRTLGRFKRAYLGSTTEPGIRQRGSNDSLPAIFDEFEIDNKMSAQRIEAIISLFRMCSDAHDGRLYKGSQDQSKAVSYTVQSAACFSSITPSIKHFADITRITTLTLKTEHGKEQERKENFKNVERIISELMGDDRQSHQFAEQFVAYSILNAPKIIASWKAFKEAAAVNNDFSSRIADQIGMLLAGWWVYENDKPCTIEQASDILKSHNWQDLVPNKGQQNQNRLLRTLAQYEYDIDNEDKDKPRKYGRNIGRLVEYLAHEFLDDYEKGHPDGRYFPPSVVREFLLNKGIIVKDGFIYFANTSDALHNILYGTQWEADWKTTLKAIHGAKVTQEPTYFGSGIGMSRGVGIPIEIFLDNAPIAAAEE